MFKPYEAIPAKKVASRSSRFKLAYVENSIDQDRKGFDMESDTKTKDFFNMLSVTPGVCGHLRTVTTSGRLGRFSSITFISFFFLAVITLMIVFMLLFVFFFVLIMFLLLTVRIK